MMGTRKRMKDNRGFTLVELIVATSVLAVIMTPLLRLFVMAGNTIRSSSDFGLTTVAMENAQELVLGVDFMDLSELLDLSDISDIKGSDLMEDALKKLSPYSSSTDVDAVLKDKDIDADGSVNMVKYGVTGLKTGNTGGHIEVTIAKITDTTDKNSIHYNALYGGVKDTDFSSFTAMDLTMVQPGFVSDGSGGVEISRSSQVDFRSAISNAVVDGVTNLDDVQRIIRVTLNQKDKLVGSTDKYQMVEYSTVYEYYADNGSGDASTYREADILESKEIFSGESYIGTDGVFSVQLVYFPLYHQDRDLIVVETSNASTEKSDFGVKFFLIKQDVVGYEHPFILDSSGNNEIVKDGSLSASNSEYDYSAYVYLDDVDDHFALYTNIHYDVSGLYTTPISSDFLFNSKASASSSDYDVPKTLTSKLVADSDDSRGFNILVEAFDGDGAEPVNQMMTVKLN